MNDPTRAERRLTRYQYAYLKTRRQEGGSSGGDDAVLTEDDDAKDAGGIGVIDGRFGFGGTSIKFLVVLDVHNQLTA
ncbi:hypothetical protein EST38_g10308 [Candolleomyces aberdarensis]|uniref:Uncharacterized protein n=1 Tax=Candolleomyces aberdarensis TaxID=2316362 RepID=A0A4Q2DAY5_9AGAR|nr:hypothetical protein EST38_g10308 [Candolleomyces aberdarensis]